LDVGEATIEVINEHFGSGTPFSVPVSTGGEVSLQITNSSAQMQKAKKRKQKQKNGQVPNGERKNGAGDAAAGSEGSENEGDRSGTEVAEKDEGGYMLSVTAHNAQGLPQLSMFSVNRPYVKVC
jgi:hypothetical protein